MQVNNAVLVSLNISLWQANRQDRKISEQVTDAHEVKDKRLGRFWKSLLPKCEVLDRMYAAQRAARTFHYENTLAWMHDGPRILPTANYEHYMAQMRRHKAAFEAAVLDLIEQYDDIRRDAALVLGKLYNEDDYPEKAALRAKYDFDIKVMTMPASEGMLALGLDSGEAQELRDKLEADMRETFRRANRRLWNDMHERLEKLTSRLSDADAHVRDDTIQAVRDLADLLPRLNVTNDEHLDALAKKLQATLQNINGVKVKTDPSVRQRVAQETQSVFNVMQAFMAPKRATAAPTTSSLPEIRRAA